ncbi:Universal stress protein A-like protein [Melia azedarach]|uniref:Universal stress protein A-like protein n=1 Tax=Melia azedarach TaxID=155640 RepID=A0ACC1Y8R3_MELAZ|nr:Universal stress protein A-like protein [Melia azedarach]
MAGDEKVRKILVAVDEGEESLYALRWCLKNVISSKNTILVLLYAKPPRAVQTALDGTGYLFSSDILSTMEKYGSDVADRVMDKAKRICRDHHMINEVEGRVECGDPRDVICDMVEKLGVDVLVMGSHGYGWFKRAFLGSVSNYCAQNVKCPVLIVKKPKSNC